MEEEPYYYPEAEVMNVGTPAPAGLSKEDVTRLVVEVTKSMEQRMTQSLEKLQEGLSQLKVAPQYPQSPGAGANAYNANAMTRPGGGRFSQDARGQPGGRGAPQGRGYAPETRRSSEREGSGYRGRSRSPGDNRDWKCYNCSKEGHIARDCPNYDANVWCEYCARRGHTTEQCGTLAEARKRSSAEGFPPEAMKRLN